MRYSRQKPGRVAISSVEKHRQRSQVQLEQELQKRSRPVKIVLDAMGGDVGARVNIEGVLMAIEERHDLRVILAGQEREIFKHINPNRVPSQIEIFHANEIVDMAESPTKAVRNPETSISKGLELCLNKEAEGFVSMGNTGAVVASSLIGLGRIQGIMRPALMTLFPSEGQQPTLILDVGASVDCKPEHLNQFAIMGSAYAEQIFRIPNPSVGLLSIGEEPSKGNSVVKKTHEMLKQADLNFIGNVESREIIAGTCNVVVCDGFVGNVLIKFAESTFKTLKKSFKGAKGVGWRVAFGGFMLLPAIQNMMQDYDYRAYGGAPLLGVRGNVIIGHGRSTPLAIKNALLFAQKMAIANLEQVISDKISEETAE